MAVGGQNSYPALQEIADLVRSFVDDDKQGLTGTPGEGQILTNNATLPQSITLQNFMNSAIREVYREIRIMGQPTLIKDNYILYGVTPVNSALGVGVPNPAVQVALQFVGYFDGLTMNPNLTLPSDLLFPLNLWERENGTQNPFGEMTQSSVPLCPRNQVQWLGEWEWRTDGIWMNGATLARDLRLRYICTYPNLAYTNTDWTQTFVPIMDSQEAIADKIAVRYCRRLGGAQLQDAIVQADRSILRLKQQVTRARQRISFERPIYGNGAAGAAGSPALYLY